MGVCSHPALGNGVVCGATSFCYNGVCSPCTNNLVCTPANPCHNGRTSCSTGTSVCVDQGTIKSDNTSCDDNSVCTQISRCQSGTCTGTLSIDCTVAPSACKQGTALSCNPTSGCPYPNQPDGTPCGFLNSCLNGVCTCGLAGGQQCCPNTTECLGGAGYCLGSNRICTVCGATGQNPCFQETTLATRCLNPLGSPARYCCRAAAPASGGSQCP
jgi:hypothetical protein